MNMRTVTKLGAAALLLSAIGFVGAIGVLTLVFAPRSGAYAPTSSSDAAAWVQAIGSIAAIVGAFVLGNWQARVARETALELERARERTRTGGLAGILTQLLKLSYNTLRTIQTGTFEDFEASWKNAIGIWMHTTIEAATQLPLYDLGSPARIFCAVRVRDMASDVHKLASAIAAKPPADIHKPLIDDSDLNRLVDLFMNQITTLQAEHEKLYE